VVSRAPSLLAYDPDALRRKLSELALLFGSEANVLTMIRREPALLTYNVQLNLAAKVPAARASNLPSLSIARARLRAI